MLLAWKVVHVALNRSELIAPIVEPRHLRMQWCPEGTKAGKHQTRRFAKLPTAYALVLQFLLDCCGLRHVANSHQVMWAPRSARNSCALVRVSFVTICCVASSFIALSVDGRALSLPSVFPEGDGLEPVGIVPAALICSMVAASPASAACLPWPLLPRAVLG